MYLRIESRVLFLGLNHCGIFVLSASGSISLDEIPVVGRWPLVVAPLMLCLIFPFPFM